MALSTYLLLCTAFLRGASGDPENPTLLPSNFVFDPAGGHVTVTLAQGAAENMTFRHLFIPVSGKAIDVEIEYRVLSGQAKVNPGIFSIHPTTYLNQGGASFDGGAHGAGTYAVRARFGASGSPGAAWPELINWTSAATRLRPSAIISNVGSGTAVVVIDRFTVNLVTPAVDGVTIPSTIDGYLQPARYFKGAAGAPLIVSVHSWHGTYSSYDSFAATLAFAVENNWSFISPDFRGSANDPTYQTLHAGSDKAIQDVIDARAWALADSGAGPVYIMGGSGGSYMALLVAAKHPGLFDAVGGYAGFVDLAAWYEWCSRRADMNLQIYSNSVSASLGGSPTALPGPYGVRSPMQYLDALQGIPVHIQHGILDQTVPLENALDAFAAIAEAKGLDAAVVGKERSALINYGRYGQALPAAVAAQAGVQGDYLYPLPFVRSAGDLELVLEQAGHNGDPSIIFDFFKRVQAGGF